MRQLGNNEMKPNCPTLQNVRLSEWLGHNFAILKGRAGKILKNGLCNNLFVKRRRTRYLFTCLSLLVMVDQLKTDPGTLYARASVLALRLRADERLGCGPRPPTLAKSRH